MVALDLTSYRQCLCSNVGEYEAKSVHSANKTCFYIRFRRCLSDFFIFIYILYIYIVYCLYVPIYISNYIKNVPTCFGDSAPSSDKVIPLQARCGPEGG